MSGMREALLGGKRFHRESRLLVRPDLKWHGPPTFCGYGGNSSKWEGETLGEPERKWGSAPHMSWGNEQSGDLTTLAWG